MFSPELQGDFPVFQSFITHSPSLCLRDDAEKFKNETKDIVESGDLNEELRGNEAKLTYKLQNGNLQEDEIKKILTRLNIIPKQYYLEKR